MLSLKLLMIVPIVLSPLMAWLVWIMLVQTTICGKLAGAVKADPGDRVMMGYLGSMIILCAVALWADAIHAWMAR